MSQSEPLSSQYAFWVKLSAWAATSTALLLLLLKLYAWFVTGASAMLATATDSLLDLFASAMNLVILRFALAPADDEHKFGHGKAESLAGLVQSAFVLGSAILLIATGIDRVITPIIITESETGITVTVITIVLTLLLVALQHYVVQKTQSVAISADAIHYKSDLLLNLGVLAALILSSSNWPWVDGAFTIAIGTYLLFGASKIIWQSIKHLMDHELPQQQLQQIIEIALAHKDALGIHDLRTRQSGQDKFIQFHLELDDHLSLYQAHDIGESIERKIVEQFAPCEVFIHHDPKSTIAPETERITAI